MILIIIIFVFAYLCGSIPFGYIISKSKGVNIQKRGSGNIGFANVRRIIGWKAGLYTLICDMLKGILPTILAVYFYDNIAFFVGIAAIIGHIFPIWLNFKGGKGIATGLGVVIVLSPITAMSGALFYLLCILIHAKSSTASIVGVLSLGIIGTVIEPLYWWHYVIFIIFALWTLRKNLTGRVPNYEK